MSKPVIISCLIIGAYCVARYFVYKVVVVNSLQSWIFRDATMDIPRTIGLIASLWYGFRRWGTRRLGFHTNGVKVVFWASLFILSLELLNCELRKGYFPLSASALFIFVSSSLLVGFFEEILFRGVLFNSLRDWKGLGWAMWGSAILFTIFHIQAQPVATWSGIFLFGLFFSFLRRSNISIIWLAVMHGVYDSIVGLLGKLGATHPMLYWKPIYLLIWSLACIFYYRCFVVNESKHLKL